MYFLCWNVERGVGSREVGLFVSGLRFIFILRGSRNLLRG